MEYDNLEVLVNYVGNFFWQIATRIETEGGANISWHLLATAFDHQFSGWLVVMIHYQFFSPSASFLITANEDGALSKFHAIFTITGFSDWCHLLKQSHASISAQLLSVGNEKALINHCMVINVRLRKHFQMQIWPKRWEARYEFIGYIQDQNRKWYFNPPPLPPQARQGFVQVSLPNISDFFNISNKLKNWYFDNRSIWNIIDW